MFGTWTHVTIGIEIVVHPSNGVFGNTNLHHLPTVDIEGEHIEHGIVCIEVVVEDTGWSGLERVSEFTDVKGGTTDKLFQGHTGVAVGATAEEDTVDVVGEGGCGGCGIARGRDGWGR